MPPDARSEHQRRIDEGREVCPAPWRETAWTCSHAERRLDRPCCADRGLCHRLPDQPTGVTGEQCNALRCPFDAYAADTTLEEQ
jgi:hypothetical protein